MNVGRAIGSTVQWSRGQGVGTRLPEAGVVVEERDSRMDSRAI